MRSRRTPWRFLLFVALPVVGTAQEVYSSPPLAGITESPVAEVVTSPSFRYHLDRPAPVILDSLSAEARKPRVQGQLRSIGISRALTRQTMQRGEWSAQTGNRHVWRMLVQTDDARFVRLHFVNFHAGAGSVYVTNPDNLAETFRYTQDGPHGDGEFWSAIIAGTSAMVEWETDGAGAAATKPPFDVESLGHLLAVSPQLQLGDYACYVDYACSTSTLGPSAPQLTYVQDGHHYVCSGTLVNPNLTDTSLAPKPLLLTANHCISDDATARTVQAVQGDWYTTCGGNQRGMLYQVTGLKLLAHTGPEAGDHSLIQLGNFPAGSNWYLAGWTTGSFSIGATVGGVHHPDGLPLKISYGNRAADMDTTVRDVGFAPGTEYYHVVWSSGAAGGGSSGSGLFESNLLRGTLTWGNGTVNGSQCSTESGYGRLGSGFSTLQPYMSTSAGGSVISKIASPAASATITGSQATFSWNASADATEYQVWVGTSPGSYNVALQSAGSATSTTITGLPTDGSTLYVRLWTHLALQWYFSDTSYKTGTHQHSLDADGRVSK